MSLATFLNPGWSSTIRISGPLMTRSSHRATQGARGLPPVLRSGLAPSRVPGAHRCAAAMPEPARIHDDDATHPAHRFEYAANFDAITIRVSGVRVPPPALPSVLPDPLDPERVVKRPAARGARDPRRRRHRPRCRCALAARELLDSAHPELCGRGVEQRR